MSPAVYQPSDLPSRIASKIEVDSESGCWLWTGSCNRESPSGYGTVAYQGKTQLVHRVVFKLLVGEIPEGFQVSHAEPRGPNHTRCCNPHHLEAVTREEALRRRDWERARARRTHCRHGHEYTPENTYLDPRGFRQCRACRSERDKSR
ncbi:HNH endonuclease [Streptomyces akebiae]|uniref:HNH endonuclease n=1 Tax=Streptomyces akebiae TaxID=2865673 RepID=A0ABX8XKL4_9ACTN|nr:HNH endonuclease [Streptomyces akebiae]